MENIKREELLKKVLKDNSIKKIINDNNISYDIVESSLNVMLAYVLKKEKCKKCNGLNSCNQANIGYAPNVSYSGKYFSIDYVPCDYLKEQIEQNNKNKNLVCISCNFSNFNFEDVYINKNRQNALLKIKEIIANVDASIPTKGLFIHGKYGCGKTYLLAYLAKTLASKNHQVIFAYYPDLVRSIKSSITDGSLEDTIEELKNAEILILDDFGGEMLTNFIRDEVLGAILQDRMTNSKLTFMSSNLDENLLMSHLKESTKDIDELRASRIYERIRALMDFVFLNDENYRK